MSDTMADDVLAEVEDPDEDCPVWTTAKGEKIPIEDMENGHLINTINYLKRRHEMRIFGMVGGPRPQGDMAQDAFDQELRALEDKGPVATYPIYEYLIDEARMRAAEYKFMAAQLKHGPDGKGSDGPCPPTCEKCAAEGRQHAFEEAIK